MKNQESPQNFRDQVIRCCDCGNDFVWTAAEQKFYKSKLLSPPRRCRSCRKVRRDRINPDMTQLPVGDALTRPRQDLDRYRW